MLPCANITPVFDRVELLAFALEGPLRIARDVSTELYPHLGAGCRVPVFVSEGRPSLAKDVNVWCELAFPQSRGECERAVRPISAPEGRQTLAQGETLGKAPPPKMAPPPRSSPEGAVETARDAFDRPFRPGSEGGGFPGFHPGLRSLAPSGRKAVPARTLLPVDRTKANSCQALKPLAKLGRPSETKTGTHHAL